MSSEGLGMSKTSLPTCVWLMAKRAPIVASPSKMFGRWTCRVSGTGLFDTGKDTPFHLLKAKNDENHQKLMTLREKGILEGQGLTYNLDIMQSFVIVTPLPQEWNKETKHTCICRSSFKH